MDLLDAALRLLPEEERRAFWKQHVQEEPALAPLARNHKLLQLARTLP